MDPFYKVVGYSICMPVFVFIFILLFEFSLSLVYLVSQCVGNLQKNTHLYVSVSVLRFCLCRQMLQPFESWASSLAQYMLGNVRVKTNKHHNRYSCRVLGTCVLSPISSVYVLMFGIWIATILDACVRSSLKKIQYVCIAISQHLRYSFGFVIAFPFFFPLYLECTAIISLFNLEIFVTPSLSFSLSFPASRSFCVFNVMITSCIEKKNK